MKKNNVYIIAEIGINHDGDISKVFDLIDMAVRSGCDAVKFQKRTPKICVPEDVKFEQKDTIFGIIDYIEYKNKMELMKLDYDDIDQYCKLKGIEWFASAWDIPSQKFLRQYNLKYNKVASAMITNLELLEEIASEQKLTFISTGYATEFDIIKAINIFKSHKCEYVLMHCTGLYPCPNNKLNLNRIKTLKDTYGGVIGYSSHSPGILDTTIATVLGARYLEVHITLDRSSKGTDHAASLEEGGLTKTVKYANMINKMLGNGKKRITKKEYEKLSKMKYW